MLTVSGFGRNVVTVLLLSLLLLALTMIVDKSFQHHGRFLKTTEVNSEILIKIIKGLAIMSKNALKQTAFAVGLTILYGLTISQASVIF